MAKLKVGAAKVNIDPTPDMYPIPGRRTDFGLPPMQYEAKYDDCNVRAIAVDNGKMTILFMAFEGGSAQRDVTYPAQIGEAVGIPAENVFIVQTHNHTSPGTGSPGQEGAVSDEIAAWNARYDKIVYEAGVAAAKQAMDSRRPAKWGYGESQSYTNVNRNLKTLGGYWTEARNLGGFSDHTLSILKFVDMDDKLIAAFMNHPTHATCCYMLKDHDHKAKTSGNFTGIASTFVETKYDGSVALWSSGAAGDQNPVLSHGLQYEWPDGYTSQIQYPDGVGYMQMEYMGRYHGADCVKGIEAIKADCDELDIKHVKESVWLKARQQKVYDMSFIPRARGGGQGPRPEEYPYGTLPPLNMGPEMIPADPKELILDTLVLGDVALIFMNCELFNKLGEEVKDASPLKNTVIVTHHTGPRVGYIFDADSADIKVPMAYSGIVPGVNDEAVIEGTKAVFKKLNKD